MLANINMLCYSGKIGRKIMKKSILLFTALLTTVATSALAQEDVSNPIGIISKARQEGIIGQDNGFVIDTPATYVKGKLWCTDDQIQANFEAIKNGLDNPNLDPQTLTPQVRSLLKCASVSAYQEKGVNLNFNGNFRYPVCDNGSVLTVPSPSEEQKGTLTVTCTESNNIQSVTASMVSDTNKKLANITVQYDIPKMMPIFELGVLSGMSRNEAQHDRIRARAMELVSQYTKSLNAPFSIKNLTIYKPDENPLLLITENQQKNYVASLFNSAQKEVMSIKQTKNGIILKANFPESANPFVAINIQFPENIKEKYQRVAASLSTASHPEDVDVAAVGKLLEDVHVTNAVYSLNSEPFAKLKLQTRDRISLTQANPPQIEDVVDNAELVFVKQTATCPVRSVRFTYKNPQMLTICKQAGCSDVAIPDAADIIVPCLDSLQPAAERFMQEVEAEKEKLDIESIYIPGFSDGYRQARRRYEVNEIINSAMMVAIMAQTSNDGTEKNLSSLNTGSPASSILIDSDNAIRATKEGITTIELKPEHAGKYMPLLRSALSDRIVSGCTADTNICVIRSH